MTKRQQLQHSLRVEHATASQTKTWIDRELVGSEFRDARLNKRFRKLFEQLSDGMGESIPLVCQTGPTPKPPIDFFPTSASAKQ
jgi:Transposase DNA-binding